MQKTGRTLRATRTLGAGVLTASLLMGLGAVASNADDTDEAAAKTTPTPAATTASPEATATPDATDPTTGAGSADKEPQTSGSPFGSQYPVTLESNFARPYRAISSARNSDFTQLNDLERIIRGSYKDPRTGNLRPASVRRSNSVFMSISRMDHSHRVGRELIRAAKAGVKVRVIHGKASQSSNSRALQKALGSKSLRDAKFKICSKGKSLACLSGLNGAIMHSKILLVNSTYTRDNKPAKGVIWTGSANLGGPSAERTYNNGLTVYNDKKLWYEMRQMWDDMWAERNVGRDYSKYIAKKKKRYGYGTLGP